MSNPAWVRPVTLSEPALSIRLEPLTPAHAPDLLRVADPELFRHTMQGPAEWSAAGFEAELRSVIALPDVIAFAIVLNRGPDAGRAIGRTTYMDIKAPHRGLEIGRTWIGRAYHGSRVNPEAKYLMLRHAFESLSPPAIRVQITTNETNLHSQRAIAKLGAVREGLLRQSRIMPPGLGRPEPTIRGWVVFSIIDSEWPGVKTSLESRLRAAAATGTT